MHAPLRRLGDPAQDFQERAFARAVAPDDAHHFAPFDLKGNILERPEILARSNAGRRKRRNPGMVSGNRLFRFQFFEKAPGFFRDDIAQRSITLPLDIMPDAVFFTET
jgi:hypothetical protein